MVILRAFVFASLFSAALTIRQDASALHNLLAENAMEYLEEGENTGNYTSADWQASGGGVGMCMKGASAPLACCCSVVQGEKDCMQPGSVFHPGVLPTSIDAFKSETCSSMNFCCFQSTESMCPPDMRVGLHVGAKVRAKYKNGRWYGATLVGYSQSTGSWTVKWDDGTNVDLIKGPKDISKTKQKVTSLFSVLSAETTENLQGVVAHVSMKRKTYSTPVGYATDRKIPWAYTFKVPDVQDPERVTVQIDQQGAQHEISRGLKVSSNPIVTEADPSTLAEAEKKANLVFGTQLMPRLTGLGSKYRPAPNNKETWELNLVAKGTASRSGSVVATVKSVEYAKQDVNSQPMLYVKMWDTKRGSQPRSDTQRTEAQKVEYESRSASFNQRFEWVNGEKGLTFEVKEKHFIGASHRGEVELDLNTVKFPGSDVTLDVLSVDDGSLFCKLFVRIEFGGEKIIATAKANVEGTFPQGNVRFDLPGFGTYEYPVAWSGPKMIEKRVLDLTFATGSPEGKFEVNFPNFGTVTFQQLPRIESEYDKQLCTRAEAGLHETTTKPSVEEATDLDSLFDDPDGGSSLPSFLDTLHDKPNQHGTGMTRDYTILIDRSGSMSWKDKVHMPDIIGEKYGGAGMKELSRWIQVEAALRFLAPYVIEEDPDGVAVYFFDSKFDEYPGVCSDKDVMNLFKKNRPGGGTYLAEVLKEAMAPDTVGRAETIFVLTDGSASDGAKTADNIIAATKKMCKDEMLSISFIQVGYDTSAAEYLNSLDDDLEKRGARFDIVDAMTADEMNGKSFLDIVQMSIHD